jgi:hypothetical protein
MFRKMAKKALLTMAVLACLSPGLAMAESHHGKGGHGRTWGGGSAYHGHVHRGERGWGYYGRHFYRAYGPNYYGYGGPSAYFGYYPAPGYYYSPYYNLRPCGGYYDSRGYFHPYDCYPY